MLIFVSLNADELMSSRKADGSLPDINFLRPAAGSRLIGAGEFLGVDYTGTTLGCFSVRMYAYLFKERPVGRQVSL
ncbi:MAG: DUF4990 domain-containing protein [Bacteroides sp.]|nr:DUF4990 domain-containing protein [Bacteroides sp.]